MSYKNGFRNKEHPFNEIQLHNMFDKTKVKIFYPPEKGHAYIIGADPSMGTKSDFHAMSIFDITNTFSIKQVASYYDNDTPPKVFAYMLAKIGTLYNNAYIAMENNGCSQVTLDAVWRDYDYDYIVSEGGNAKTSIGIHSSNARKVEACINFKELIEDPTRAFEINDGRLIAEMETFEKRTTYGKMPTYNASNGHDDFIMATIWAMFALKMEIVERYYDVKKIVLNKLGDQMPLFIMPFDFSKPIEDDYMNNLDQRLSSFRTSYERELQEAKKVSENKEFEAFINANKLKAYDADSREASQEADKLKSESNSDEFTFGGFF